MSLINEALKKAQRARHEGDAASASGAETSGPVAKRARPKSARSMVWIAVGAVALVVASMVATALWITRPDKPAVVATAKAPAPAATTSTEEKLPAINPLVSLPAPTPSAAPASAPGPVKTAAVVARPPTTPATASPAPVKPLSPEPATVLPAPASTSVASTPSPGPQTPKAAPAVAAPAEPAAQPALPPKPDERIHQFVEALKVTGIRSSGTESKVLMNDRVFRVNDVVDRALGVRLTKVEPDNLTFTDANGATYVKFF